jgi:hypothetical protein
LAIAYSPRRKKREKEPVKEYRDGLKNVNRKPAGRFISWKK